MDGFLADVADGATVVTANNRQARSLRFVYDRHQSGQGRQVWPSARILPWRSWLESRWEASLLAGGAAGQFKLLTPGQARFLWQQVIADEQPGTLHGTSAAMARSAVQAFGLAQSWQIDPAILEDAADSRDSQIFARWAGLYVERCGARSWLDESALPPLIAADLNLPRLKLRGPLYFSGFEEHSPQQQALLDAAGRAGTEMRSRDDLRPAPGVAHTIGCRDGRHEIEMAARWARHVTETRPGARVGVIVPDLATRAAEVRRVFLDIFVPAWRTEDLTTTPVNVSFGQQLAQVGVIHTALTILRALNGVLDYREVGHLLRSQFLLAFESEAGRRAQLDLYVRQQIGANIDLTALSGRAQRKGLAWGEALAAVLRRRAQSSGSQLPSGWVGIFSESLGDMGWPGAASLASAEYQALLAWQKLLDEFAACDRIAGRIARGAAVDMLAALAAEQLFQPDSEPDVVQVLGLLEGLGLPFDALWVCGVRSDTWPPPARPNPLLPLGLQRRLGIPDSTPARVRDRAERRLRTLTHSADEVWFSWPRKEGDESLEPSPLIRELPQVIVGDLPCYGSAVRTRQLFGTRPALRWSRDAPPALRPGERPRGGARLLALQAACPARAFFELRLGVREMDVPPPGLVPRIRGEIVHAVLEKFFRDVRSRDALRIWSAADLGQRLGELLEAELQRRLPDRDSFSQSLTRVEISLILPVLTAFLEQESERRFFEIVSIEADREERLGELTIRLRPDRIDRLESGALLIVDYKTGDFSRSGWFGPRLREPQLPLYATLLDAQAIAVVRLRRDGIRWISAGDDEGLVPDSAAAGKTRGKPKEDWDSLRTEWQLSLENVAAEIARGDCRINPRKPDLAKGQWAMLTRVHELSSGEAEETDE